MKPDFSIAELKQILDNLDSPNHLDNHPWTQSLTVSEVVENDLGLQQKSPGFQLVVALSRLFRKMLPSALPRHGKRLDTPWYQFGLLAARYFAPFEFGLAYPKTLHDAVGCMDEALFLYVFGKTEGQLSQLEIESHKLIGDEAEWLPISTLSDWHTRGLQRLLDLFCSHEQYLSLHPKESGEISLQDGANSRLSKLFQFLRLLKGYFKQNWPKIRLGLLILFFLLVGGKGVFIYLAVKPVTEDIQQFKALNVTAKGNWTGQLRTIGPLLSKSRADMARLNDEIGPLLWVGRGLGWAPVYGGDLANAQSLLTMGDNLAIAADEAYQAGSPMIDSIASNSSASDLSGVITQISVARPQWTRAQVAMDQALLAESKIESERLSPGILALYQTLEPVVSSADDVLTAVVALPEMVGATGGGPKTYMLLLQNEDELRATGGFITAVGTVAVENGKVLSYKIEDSYALDDPNQYYPPAPWQLADYMDASQWMLRDANWFPDFPTSAKWTEMFFAMSQSYGVDGVIAIDQQAIRLLLAGLGPVEIQGVGYPITADNVIEYMRSAKSPAPSEQLNNDWWVQRKDFMQGLAQAILDRVQSGKDFSWLDFSRACLQALNERHILVEMDDSTVAGLLAKHGWDGAVRTEGGDYLMVVDSNLGFNKVNAVVKEDLSYAVDLSNLKSPLATLTVNNQNNAPGNPVCEQKADYGNGSYAALIDRCYWDYLRVYSLADAVLEKSSPRPIPGNWLMGGKNLPAQMDNLIDENNSSIKGYGTFFVVPGSQSQAIHYEFALPEKVLQIAGNEVAYHLTIQKQPGTQAEPVEIMIRLPAKATMMQASLSGKQSGNDWVFTDDLQQDIHFEITFALQ